MTRKSRVRKQLKKINSRRKTDDRNTRIVDQYPAVVQLGNGYVFDHNATEEDLAQIDPAEKLLWDIFTGGAEEA